MAEAARVTAVITANRGARSHPTWPGGVHQRLRDLPRSPSREPDRHPPPAGGQYRGTSHAPTSIDHDRRVGLSVLPISSVRLDYPVTSERISTGVDALDADAGRQGLLRAAACWSPRRGTGKSSFARRSPLRPADGRALPIPGLRGVPCSDRAHMASIGIDLARWVKDGRLHFHAVRSTLYGLEHTWSPSTSWSTRRGQIASSWTR